MTFSPIRAPGRLFSSPLFSPLGTLGSFASFARKRALSPVPVESAVLKGLPSLQRIARQFKKALSGLLLSAGLACAAFPSFAGAEEGSLEGLISSLSEKGPLDFITGDSASNIVPNFGADVSHIQKHYGGGQGNLLEPGTAEVEKCLNASSMECRAVQAVLDAGQAPAWDTSDFDKMLGGADEIKTNAGSLPGGDGGVVCETVKTELPALTEFKTCDAAVNSEFQGCFSGWSSSMEFETLFQCIDRTQKVVEVTCQNPYVPYIADYTCTEAPRATCVMGTEVNVSSAYLYRCVVQQFKKETYRCNKVLQVVGFAGCEPGSMQEAVAEDGSHLGKDPCNGGDAIYLKFACSDASPPLLRIETNVKNSANFGFDIQAFDFDVEKKFSNCKGHWKGKTRCTGVNCVTEVTMDVYYENKGSYKFSGSLSKVFGYTTYSHSVTNDIWVDSCVGLDTDTLEAR